MTTHELAKQLLELPDLPVVAEFGEHSDLEEIAYIQRVGADYWTTDYGFRKLKEIVKLSS